MEILRKNVHMSRRKSQVISQVTLDSDCNVPDARPDVEKLVLDRGEVRVEEVKPDKDRISLKGYLEVEVLYASAGAGRASRRWTPGCPLTKSFIWKALNPGTI